MFYCDYDGDAALNDRRAILDCSVGPQAALSHPVELLSLPRSVPPSVHVVSHVQRDFLQANQKSCFKLHPVIPSLKCLMETLCLRERTKVTTCLFLFAFLSIQAIQQHRLASSCSHEALCQ